MKAYIKVLAIFLLNFILSQSTIAQNSSEVFSSVRNHLDSMFEDLDKTKINTGFLEDCAIDLVNLHLYDGLVLNDDNIVTRPIFEDIIRSISSAAVRPHDIVTQGEQIIEDLGPSITSELVYLRFVLFRYQYIAPNALTANKIAYNEATNQVSDVYQDGTWINPYQTSTLFAFAPSATSCIKKNVAYQFNCLPALLNMSISAVWFDAGDGNGYRQIDTPSDGIIINYSNEGLKTLKLKVRATTGQTFESHAQINILGNAQIHNLNETTASEAEISNQFTVEKNGITATVSCYSVADAQLHKPVIFVEGFDPWQLKQIQLSILGNNNNNNGEQLENYFGFTNHKGHYSQDYLDILHNSGYDYVYIDWHDSLCSIELNGELLIEIINEINRIKSASGSTESNIVIGQSMGGLIARYALTEMEKREDDHQVSTFVSHDVPYLGVNVPIGFQYLVNQLLCFMHGYSDITDLESFKHKFNSGEEIIYDIIHSAAAKQMMYYYVEPDGTATTYYHDAFQSKLSEMGFPKGDRGRTIENIALVNGRPFDNTYFLVDNQHLLRMNGSTQSFLFTNAAMGFFKLLFKTILSQDLFNIEWSKFDLGHRGVGSAKLEFNVSVNPSLSFNQTTPVSSFVVKYYKRYLWKENATVYNLFDSQSQIPSDMPPYDILPGSIYSFDDTDKVSDISPLIKKSADNSMFNYYLGLTGGITFVPTASALCIQDDNLNFAQYMEDYFYLSPHEINTPFDAYYLFDVVGKHISFYNERTETIHTAFEWLLNQINMEITGPNFILSEGQYNINGLTEDAANSIEWISSDPSIATIDASGKVTAIGNGVVTIIAQHHSNGKLFRKKKDIYIGFPNLIINRIFYNNVGYRFTAKAVDSNQQNKINELIANGELSYEWHIIDDSGNMVEPETINNYIDYIPGKDEYITVALRLVDKNGNKGPTISLYTNILAPFVVNYNSVIIDKNGMTTFTLLGHYYEVGLPSHDLITNYRQIALDSNDNIMTLWTTYLKGPNCYLKYNDGINSYILEGIKDPSLFMWEFEFFDSQSFLTRLSQMLSLAGTDERAIDEFDIMICNSEKEVLQRHPFAIVYNPDFHTPTR